MATHGIRGKRRSIVHKGRGLGRRVLILSVVHPRVQLRYWSGTPDQYPRQPGPGNFGKNDPFHDFSSDLWASRSCFLQRRDDGDGMTVTGRGHTRVGGTVFDNEDAIEAGETIMGLWIIGAALSLLGIVVVSRVRSSRRLHAALNAYAELETVREPRKPVRT